jgi:hypothetical protein
MASTRQSFIVSKELLISYLLGMISLRYAMRWCTSLSRRRQLLENTKTLATLTDSVKSNGFTLSDEEYLGRLQQHQSKAARLSVAEEVRTLLTSHHASTGYGVLSTNSASNPGYPTGSIVGFEVDENGLPFFVLSKLSGHTKDVLKDSKVSLVVTANDFKGAADARVSILGDVSRVSQAGDNENIEQTTNRRKELRERYLARHKDAFWIDFG